MHSVDIISTSRADFGFVQPMAEAIARRNGIAARVVFTGSHGAEGDHDGFRERKASLKLQFVEVAAEGIGGTDRERGAALGAMSARFAALWNEAPPSMVLLSGDRFELLPVAAEALVQGIPIAHAFGGECDAHHCLDTGVRNAITKMAVLHFVSHEAMADRLVAMGEERWRCTVMGDPGIQAVQQDSAPFLELAAERGWGSGPFIAACYLPPTTMRGRLEGELSAILSALDDYPKHTVVWAGLNVDPGAEQIRARLLEHRESRRNHHFVESLGKRRYHSLLSVAEVLVGNSSSGILEAASFGLPVVNVGVRQAGRLSGVNVLHVPGDQKEISAAIRQSLVYHGESCFKEMENPFHLKDGTERLADAIQEALAMPRERLLLKKGSDAGKLEVRGLRRVPEWER